MRTCLKSAAIRFGIELYASQLTVSGDWDEILSSLKCDHYHELCSN